MLILKKIISYIKTEPIVFIFFCTLILSWSIHISFRNNHFQEVDSSGTYYILYEFPLSTLRSTALMYPPGNFLTVEQAQKILSNPTVQDIRNKYLSKFTDDFIINQLTKSSALATFRFGLIQASAILNLPFPLQGFFAMGLGSTYSSGVGFVYTLFSGEAQNYSDFMSSAMSISITIFHLTILLLFLINRKLGVGTFTNIIVCLIALFSISLYSSGINIGSTVWNFSTEFLWLWVLFKEFTNFSDPKFIRKISWLTGILVFFNYLILLFWIALMLIYLFENLSRVKGFASKLRVFFVSVRKILNQQKAAVVLIGLCAILFFQPGQGFRGSTPLSDLPSNFYYILLNFFSWYPHSYFLNVTQFLFALALCTIGFKFLITKNKANSKVELARKIFINLLIIYALLVLKQTLSFVPTRHILFLTPILFISIALGLQNIWSNIEAKLSRILQISLVIGIVTIGVSSLKLRQIDSADLTGKIIVDPDVTSVGIYDASFDILYKNKDSKIPFMFIDPKTFEVDKNYLYVSRVAPFSFALKDWDKRFNIKTEVLSGSVEMTDAYFVAYNPDQSKFGFSRPNNLYQTKFKVLSITIK